MDRVFTALLQMLLQVLRGDRAPRGRAMIWRPVPAGIFPQSGLLRFEFEFARCYAVSGCVRNQALQRPVLTMTPPWLFARREARFRAIGLD